MLKLKEKYVVDEKGKKTAVILDVGTYQQLLEHIEALEDALDLDNAVHEAKSFRSYDKIGAKQRRTGEEPEMKWRVILEQDPETGDWAAWCPELPGCASAGCSEAEALENIGEAIELYLQQDPLELEPGAVIREIAA